MSEPATPADDGSAGLSSEQHHTNHSEPLTNIDPPQDPQPPSPKQTPLREEVPEILISASDTPQSQPSNHLDNSDHTHLDSEDELLETSAGEGGVTQLLRTTVEDLELELQESRKLLKERDEELALLRMELDRYKQQTAREIANKTKLAQSLDESHSHAQELEELLQRWQLELHESKRYTERLQNSLQQEHDRCENIETELSRALLDKEREIEQLKSQLVDSRQTLAVQQDPLKRTSSGFTIAEDCNPGPDGVDKMQLHFLKQAVYHLLTDFHAEDQLRAIVSILDFSAQERKAVYAKVEEKKKQSRGLYM